MSKKKSGWIGLIGYIACIASVIPVHQIGAGVFLLFGVTLMLWLLVWTPELSLIHISEPTRPY